MSNRLVNRLVFKFFKNMIDWCIQYEITVCNTLFKKRDVHKYTWVRRVRGEIVESALMDYMCISEKYRARVTDMNVSRAARKKAWAVKTCPVDFFFIL